MVVPQGLPIQAERGDEIEAVQSIAACCGPLRLHEL